MDIPNRQEWERWAEAHHALKQKLLEKRKRLTHLLKQTEGMLKLAPAGSPTARALGYQKRLFEIAIGQMEPFNLDTNVYTPPTQVLGPAYQLREHEMNLLALQMEDVHLALIDETLAADLELAHSGQPAAQAYVEPYQRIRARLGTDAAAVEKLQAFRSGYPEHRANVEAAAELFRLAMAEPNEKARLEQVKAMRLPALKGSGFRLVGLLRQIPDGDAWWEAIKIAEAPAMSEEAPVAPEEPAKPMQRLSQRVMNLLKPSK